MRVQWRSRVTVIGAVFALFFIASPQVAAQFSSSTNYRLDGTVGNSFGGLSGSGSYSLESSGGESVIGNGASGSYRLGQGYVAKQEKSLQVSVQRANLGAYFPFDEGTGRTAYDYTLNNHRAITAPAGQPPTWPSGKVAGAMKPESTSQLSIAQTSAIRPTSEFTLSTWVNLTNLLNGNDMPIFSSLGSGNGYELRVNGSATPPYCALNDICFVMNIGGTLRSVAFLKTTESTALSNVWSHMVVTYDGTALKIYLNGVEKGSANFSGSITHGAGPLCIGSAPSGSACAGNQAALLLDETKILAGALSPAEIQAEFTAGNSGVPSGFLFPAPATSVSATLPFRTVVDTDALNYGLAINQNQDLSNGGNSIPAISGSIATPSAWNEGSTRGLGFSLAATNATAIPGKWSNGNAYAGLPLSSAVFYNRTGGGGGVRDSLDMRLRLAVDGAQAQGSYSNQMTISGTITP